MAAAKLLNLIAVSTLAIFAASFGATPVTAVSVDSHHLAARNHPHAALAKKRRSDGSKRCKPRPSSSSASGHTSAAPKPPATTTKAPAPVLTTKASVPVTTTKASSGNSGNNGGNNKVGIAWAVNDDKALANFKTGGPIYTWSPWIPAAAKGLGFQPCPMLWGPKQITQFTDLVKPGYANCVLGFNEPNQQGQSDLDPAYAAQLWKQYIEPLKNHGYTLVSPACTNAPSGKTWMKAFLAACNGGCHLDAVAVHFYGTDPQAMITYLKDIHDTFGVNVWPTEFACQNFGQGSQCSSGEVWNFMKTVKDFMDATPWISHYFAFGTLFDMGNVNPLNQLLGSNGLPTDLGKYYLS